MGVSMNPEIAEAAKGAIAAYDGVSEGILRSHASTAALSQEMGVKILSDELDKAQPAFVGMAKATDEFVEVMTAVQKEYAGVNDAFGTGN